MSIITSVYEHIILANQQGFSDPIIKEAEENKKLSEEKNKPEDEYVPNETEKLLEARTDIDYAIKMVMTAVASNRSSNRGTDYEEELKQNLDIIVKKLNPSL